MTLLGVPVVGGFSLGVNSAPKIDCSLDEMIKNRVRETVQVRQSVVRNSKRNEKLAAMRGMNDNTPAVKASPMQIEQQVQKELNTRAVRRAQQVVKQEQQQATMTGRTGGRGNRRKKTTNLEQTKVIRQIKQEGKKAAQQLGQQQQQAAAAAKLPRKAIQAARTALKENGVEIPRGYTLQLVPPATNRNRTNTTTATTPVEQQQQPAAAAGPTNSNNRRRRRPTKQS